MQKKIIALAVAALASGAAFAQSNVTVYGVADVSFESAKASGATAAGTNVGSRARVTSNSSYLGFKGSEDLGNGLKALFQLETQVSFDSQDSSAAQNLTAATTAGATAAGSAAVKNTAFTKARDSFVALNGGFGTVLAGYVSTPYRTMSAGFDVMPGAAGAGGYNGVFGKLGSGVNLNFRTQAVAYATPVFSGFSGVIAYVPNEAKSNSAAANQVNPGGYNLALNYANGGLKLGYSFLKLNDIGLGGQDDESAKAHLFAAAYDFGQGTTLSGMYQKAKDKVNNAGVGDDAKQSAYWLGAKHVMGANEFAVAYAHAGNVKGTLGATNTGANQLSLRYGYNFSKRTQAYALYSKISNKDGASYDFGGDTAVGGGFGAGANPTVYGVGLRHSF